nr:hypothetical protein BaRGS_011103 [Batillaria attramentaria]
MVKPEDGPAETNEPSSGSASGLVKPKPAPAVSKGYAHLFKYIIVGDSGTGKSALLRRYTDNEFQATHLPTIGVDFAVKSVSLPNGDEVKLQVWDTAGQERYRTITTSYYRGAMGIIIVYDVTYRETADNVSRWVEECQRYANEDIVIVVVGTKSDMKDGAVDYVSIDDMKTKEALSDVIRVIIGCHHKNDSDFLDCS